VSNAKKMNNQAKMLLRRVCKNKDYDGGDTRLTTGDFKALVV
jgi:hypothetical protein